MDVGISDCITTFEELRNFQEKVDEETYTLYLREIYREIAGKGKNNSKGITINNFTYYIKNVPIFISEKLFYSFKLNPTKYMSREEFEINMKTLKYGSFENTIAFIFNLYDFGKKNYIEQNDVKQLLSYFPLKNCNNESEYQYQLKSLEELYELVNFTFGNKNEIDINEFKQSIEKKANLFLIPLVFFYLNLPIFEKSMSFTKEKQFSSSGMNDDFQRSIYKQIYSTSSSKTFTKLYGSYRKNTDNKKRSKTTNWREINKCQNPSSEEDESKGVIKEDELELSMSNLENFLQHEGELKIYAFFEGNVGRFQTIYIKLREKHLYFYNNAKDSDGLYLKFIPLEFCFFRENKITQIENESYSSFVVQVQNSTEYIFYDKKREVIQTWIKKLRESNGYRNISDFYKIGNTINKGSFAIINIGTNINTGENVAIKIIRKEEVKKNEEWNQLKTEVDVMKLTKHPSIIKFIDYFENSYFIFIVMEYLNHGTLQDYLKEKKFKISNKEMISIILQIAKAIQYLQTFGIIHRDLKPANILIKKDIIKGNIEVKLIDFGLSKIIGMKEKIVEECGTLGFCAPEIILGKAYSKKVDIWSLGVIMYFMCSGELPFNFKNHNKEIAKLTCSEELTFKNLRFSKINIFLIDLIKCSLEKTSIFRISIDKFIKHSWFTSSDNENKAAEQVQI